MNLPTIPKVELHCHLEGVLDRAMLREIRREDAAYPVDPAEFERAYPVQTLDGFWKWWGAIEPVFGKLSYFHVVLARHIERLKAQRVRYAEIMLASSFVAGPGGADKLRALRACADRCEAGEIQVEFLVGIGRNRTPGEMESRADDILPLHAAGLIVGVALAGPELGYPVKPFHSTFARFHAAGLGIELHAGEWCGPESVWDALEYGYPDRIGHGTHLFEDERLLGVMRERNLHVEMCPTSNLKTGSIARIEDHPIARARDLGLNFSVNTDDPGIFECSLASEFELLASRFGFDERDFQTLYTNSLAARFQPVLRQALV